MKTKTCKKCNAEFRQFQVIDGKQHNFSKRSYCLECSPIGQLTMNKKPLVDGKRQCLRCKEFKVLGEYALRGKVKAFRSCCKRCESLRVLEYGQLLKIKSVAYKGGGCAICRYNRCFRSLTFHHRDPSLKEFSPGKRKGITWEAMQAELDKCVLLCANCHGEVHDGLTSLP